MWPDRVSNLGPLTYQSGALQTVLRSPVSTGRKRVKQVVEITFQKECLFSIRYIVRRKVPLYAHLLRHLKTLIFHLEQKEH